MGKCKHTKTPWRATYPAPPKCGGAGKYDWLITGDHSEEYQEDEDGNEILDEAGEPVFSHISRVVVAHVKGVEGSEDAVAANAEFLVRAANCHDELLHACKMARAFGSQGDTHEGVSVSYLLESAIAKAESQMFAQGESHEGHQDQSRI